MPRIDACPCTGSHVNLPLPLPAIMFTEDAQRQTQEICMYSSGPEQKSVAGLETAANPRIDIIARGTTPQERTLPLFPLCRKIGHGTLGYD
jgi:hypothetical protein